jgi:hypothetical protein
MDRVTSTLNSNILPGHDTTLLSIVEEQIKRQLEEVRNIAFYNGYLAHEIVPLLL